MKTHPASPPREWTLRTPQGQELRLRLERGETATVGRDLTSDLPVLDAGVSRHHATFSIEDDELWLEDLHSQNGTFVNTERIYHARILSGDIITFGRVPLTINARSERPEEADPLARLSPENLGRLVHVSRELAAEKSRAFVLQKLLELAIRTLPGDRGVIFLWEETRGHFHPVAASPQDLFQTAVHLLSHSLAHSIVRSSKARIITESRTPATASAIAAPMIAGQNTNGVLYLDRPAGRSAFGAADCDFLAAFLWVSGAALTGFADLREPLGGPAPPAAGHSLPPSRFATPLASTSDGERRWPRPEPLAALEQHLTREVAACLEPRLEPAAAQEAALRALYSARLSVEAVKQLAARCSEHFEEVVLERLGAELAAVDRGKRRYQVVAGGEQTILGSAQTLLLAVRIFANWMAPLQITAPSANEEERESGAAVQLTARPSSVPGTVALQIARTGCPAAKQEAPGDLPYELAARLVEEHLHGECEASSDGTSVELRLPQPAASLRETIVLPAHPLASRQ